MFNFLYMYTQKYFLKKILALFRNLFNINTISLFL